MSDPENKPARQAVVKDTVLQQMTVTMAKEEVLLSMFRRFDGANPKHQDKLEEVRIVCIPNQVDAEAILSGIKDTLGKKINRFNLKLIRFRNHGVTGKFKDTDSPSDDYMDNLEVKATEMGFTVIKTI